MRLISSGAALSIFMAVFTLTLLTACSKPDFTDSRGKGVDLQDRQGRWLVINFWADWCDPCREEIPELNALERKGELRVVGVDFDASQGSELEKKVESLGIRFPVLSESPLEKLKAKSPKVLPATYIVNPNGELVETLYGPQTQSGLEKLVGQVQKRDKGASGG
ncbi:MAG: TlpA family protein disulfide reductase [Endozoicomonas sp.]